MPLRFIELMPLSRADVLDESNFLPVREVMALSARTPGIWSPLHGYQPRPRTRRNTITYRPLRRQDRLHRSAHQSALLRDLQQTPPHRRWQATPGLGRHGEVDLLDALRQTRATPEDTPPGGHRQQTRKP